MEIFVSLFHFDPRIICPDLLSLIRPRIKQRFLLHICLQYHLNKAISGIVVLLCIYNIHNFDKYRCKYAYRAVELRIICWLFQLIATKLEAYSIFIAGSLISWMMKSIRLIVALYPGPCMLLSYPKISKSCPLLIESSYLYIYIISRANN